MVSAPVAAPGPVVVRGTVPVEAGPEVAVLGEAPGGEEDGTFVWAKATDALNSAAEVKSASLVIVPSLRGLEGTGARPSRAALHAMPTGLITMRFQGSTPAHLG